MHHARKIAELDIITVTMVSVNPNTKTKLNHILNNIDSILYMAEVEASNLLTHLDTKEDNNNNVNKKSIKEFHHNNLTKEFYLDELTNNNTLTTNYFDTSKIDVNYSIPDGTLNTIHSLRYYVEGVVLVPVSLIGLFGKYKKNKKYELTLCTPY